MIRKKFAAPSLTPEQLTEFSDLGRLCRGDILKMTELAGCGHPGGEDDGQHVDGWT